MISTNPPLWSFSFWPYPTRMSFFEMGWQSGSDQIDSGEHHLEGLNHILRQFEDLARKFANDWKLSNFEIIFIFCPAIFSRFLKNMNCKTFAMVGTKESTLVSRVGVRVLTKSTACWLPMLSIYCDVCHVTRPGGRNNSQLSLTDTSTVCTYPPVRHHHIAIYCLFRRGIESAMVTSILSSSNSKLSASNYNIKGGLNSQLLGGWGRSFVSFVLRLKIKQ